MTPGPGRRDVAERFWEKVDRRGPEECWPWQAARDGYGYGQFRLPGRRGRLVKAHRLAYELEVGPVPEGLTLDHLCHTAAESCAGGSACEHRACVNPEHLAPVSLDENKRRGQSPAAVNARKTHCPQGHPYDEENTVIDRNGYRECRICRRDAQRERSRRFRARQKAAA